MSTQKASLFPAPYFIGTDTSSLSTVGPVATERNFVSNLSNLLTPLAGSLSGLYAGKLQADVQSSQTKQAKFQAEVARATVESQKIQSENVKKYLLWAAAALIALLLIKRLFFR